MQYWSMKLSQSGYCSTPFSKPGTTKVLLFLEQLEWVICSNLADAFAKLKRLLTLLPHTCHSNCLDSLSTTIYMYMYIHTRADVNLRTHTYAYHASHVLYMNTASISPCISYQKHQASTGYGRANLYSRSRLKIYPKANLHARSIVRVSP